MPPHLHPRSSATTTLFASTLAASFIIVGIPHVFPCPAPRRGYLDAEGNVVPQQQQRRRRKRIRAEGGGGDGGEGEGEEKSWMGTTITTATTSGAGSGVMGRDGRLMAALTANKNGEGEATRRKDGEQEVHQQHRRPKEEEEEEQDEKEAEDEEIRRLFHAMKHEAALHEREGRECPVPKPRGKIGEWLGFGRDGQRRGRGGKDDR